MENTGVYRGPGNGSCRGGTVCFLPFYMDILCGQLFAEDIQVAFVGRSNVSYMRRSLNTWFDAKMQKFRQVFRLYLNAVFCFILCLILSRQE